MAQRRASSGADVLIETSTARSCCPSTPTSRAPSTTSPPPALFRYPPLISVVDDVDVDDGEELGHRGTGHRLHHTRLGSERAGAVRQQPHPPRQRPRDQPVRRPERYLARPRQPLKPTEVRTMCADCHRVHSIHAQASPPHHRTRHCRKSIGVRYKRKSSKLDAQTFIVLVASLLRSWLYSSE